MDTLRRSYVHGASEVPLSADTVGDRLLRTAEAFPEHQALVAVHQDIRWSWRELAARADEVGAGLLGLGLNPGDRVAIWAQNRAEWTLTQFATARAGLVLVNINPAARAEEARNQLSLIRARALIVQNRFKTSDYVAMVREIVPEIDTATDGLVHSEALPALTRVIGIGENPPTGFLPFDAITGHGNDAARARLAEVAASIQCDDPVNIQFSSASGGVPAPATLTHHNIVNNGYFVGRTLRLGSDDRVCIPVPLFHCFGMVIGNMACLGHGSAMIYPDDAFDPATTLAALQAEGCTAVYGVPAMFLAMLEHERFADHDLSTLRTGVMAGAPCPRETMEQVIQQMHMREVTIAYGMTETSPVSFMSDVDDPVDLRVGTVGTIRPHTEVKIIDGDGRVVPPDTPGELCTRGYNVMLGYWEDDARTTEVIDRAGWMHTGDLATLDARGYCRIVGGLKDVIIRGGENVYPTEVEAFLASHPAIEEVVVVGVPDRRMGEQVCACVRLAEGRTLEIETLRDYCRERIAHYKIPHYLQTHERFPDSTGRARRYLLRERAVANLGLGDTPQAPTAEGESPT